MCGVDGRGGGARRDDGGASERAAEGGGAGIRREGGGATPAGRAAGIGGMLAGIVIGRPAGIRTLGGARGTASGVSAGARCVVIDWCAAARLRADGSDSLRSSSPGRTAVVVIDGAGAPVRSESE